MTASEDIEANRSDILHKLPVKRGDERGEEGEELGKVGKSDVKLALVALQICVKS